MTADILLPVTGWELESQIRAAIDERVPIAITAGTTKSKIGPSLTADLLLNMTNLRGVDVDRAAGLAFAQSGTPLRQVERELLRYGFMLPFEPPDLGPLFGFDAWLGSIGGAFSSNVSGSRRLVAGAPSDNLVACSMITGEGVTRRLGARQPLGSPLKDLLPLVAGSWGMFGVMTEVTFRITPLPDETMTLFVVDLPPDLAVEASSEVALRTDRVTGAIHFDRGLVPRLWSDRLGRVDGTLTLIRLEASQKDLATHSQAVRENLQLYGPVETLTDAESTDFWSEVQALSVFQMSETPLWRLTVPPDKAARILSDARSVLNCAAIVDWAGGLIWLEIADAIEAGASDIRRILATHGGAATLIRCDPEIRSSVDCFQPLPHREFTMLSALKDELDPHRLFNRGRIYGGL
ncbi:MAG: FAD-binding protein [Pseudomonadota bacterium]